MTCLSNENRMVIHCLEIVLLPNIVGSLPLDPCYVVIAGPLWLEGTMGQFWLSEFWKEATSFHQHQHPPLQMLQDLSLWHGERVRESRPEPPGAQWWTDGISEK